MITGEKNIRFYFAWLNSTIYLSEKSTLRYRKTREIKVGPKGRKYVRKLPVLILTSFPKITIRFY